MRHAIYHPWQPPTWMSAIRWHFLGGIRTVTGSCHLLEVHGRKLLIDLGLFQGP